jgi:hypothetical protein
MEITVHAIRDFAGATGRSPLERRGAGENRYNFVQLWAYYDGIFFSQFERQTVRIAVVCKPERHSLISGT